MGNILQQDIWLSKLLRRPAYHVSDNIQDLSRDLLPFDQAFVDAKVEVSLLHQLHHLENLGFRLIDTNLQLFLKHMNLLQKEALKPCRWATARDEAEVTEIAAQSFKVSRFHLDPQIPDKIANEIKAVWAQSYFMGQRGNWMVVATVNDHVAGFLQLLRGSEDTLIIDLLAVAPIYRGQGLAKSMIVYAANNCLQSLQKIQVGTQVVNIPALNLYRSLGFQIEQAKYVLHLHTGLSQ